MMIDMHAKTSDVAPIRDVKATAMAQLLREKLGMKRPRTLVVGCGSGVEAAVLARELGADVVGIDLNANFDSRAVASVELRRGDATDLDFADESFEFVYSYHALEHIPNYRLALREMARVLTNSGWYCIGTPNRSRLIGYLGSQGTPLHKKIAWNMADWSARLRGRFRNEYGAHAGFTSQELADALGEVFSAVNEMTADYYRRLYGRHAFLLETVASLGVSQLMLPSIYFLGKK